jgi:hypothetical protein
MSHTRTPWGSLASRLAAVATTCLCAVAAQAATLPIHSITQIPGGTTIDFESGASHANPNTVLNAYGISGTAIGGGTGNLTTFVTWVTGNVDAPIASRAMYGHMKLTTQTPWISVGMSGVMNLLTESDSNMTITVFGATGNILGAYTRLWDGSANQAAYNANAVFVGFTSDEPIYRADFTAHFISDPISSLNCGWDNLTFVSSSGSTPEPSLLPFMGSLILLMRRAKKT